MQQQTDTHTRSCAAAAAACPAGRISEQEVVTQFLALLGAGIGTSVLLAPDVMQQQTHSVFALPAGRTSKQEVSQWNLTSHNRYLICLLCACPACRHDQ
jgi:hypothetical protein